jgi:hypothetical protein
MSTTPTPMPAWKVTGQLPISGTDEHGKSGMGVDVSFETAAGHRGHVFVLDGDYRADRVRQLLAAKAAEADAIGGLTG